MHATSSVFNLSLITILHLCMAIKAIWEGKACPSICVWREGIRAYHGKVRHDGEKTRSLHQPEFLDGYFGNMFRHRTIIERSDGWGNWGFSSTDLHLCHVHDPPLHFRPNPDIPAEHVGDYDLRKVYVGDVPITGIVKVLRHPRATTAGNENLNWRRITRVRSKVVTFASAIVWGVADRGHLREEGISEAWPLGVPLEGVFPSAESEEFVPVLLDREVSQTLQQLNTVLLHPSLPFPSLSSPAAASPPLRRRRRSRYSATFAASSRLRQSWAGPKKVIIIQYIYIFLIFWEHFSNNNNYYLSYFPFCVVSEKTDKHAKNGEFWCARF